MTPNDNTVAYPGREGAHSAAACDRLFPAARLVAAALVPGRRRGGHLAATARTACSRSRARSSGRSTRRTTSSTTRRSRSSPRRSCRSATASSGPPRSRSTTSARSARTPVALDQCRKLLASMPGRRRSSPPRPGTPPPQSPSSAIRPSSRSRAPARRGCTRSSWSPTTSATTPAYTRFAALAPYTRLDRRHGEWRTALTFETHHRPGALHTAIEPLARRRDRHGAARLAADPVAAVRLPLRLRPRRPPARRRGRSGAGEMRAETARLRVFGSYRADRDEGWETVAAAWGTWPQRSGGAAVFDARSLLGRRAGTAATRRARGASARLMKRTGDGRVGGRARCIGVSSSRRSPLRRLHGAHAVTTFSHTESPPRERGTTWSSVSRPRRRRSRRSASRRVRRAHAARCGA